MQTTLKTAVAIGLTAIAASGLTAQKRDANTTVAANLSVRCDDYQERHTHQRSLELCG
jgi:hypothetical protein